MPKPRPAPIASAVEARAVRHQSPIRGFTLLEVLVALAIVAIALTAAVRAAGVSLDSSAQVKERMFATWIAQNRLAELTARHTFPELGSRTGPAAQAGRNFTWEEIVGPTPNDSFRRVEIRVRAEGQEHIAATLVGYLALVPDK
jgi:general secretion pathway protein I